MSGNTTIFSGLQANSVNKENFVEECWNVGMLECWKKSSAASIFPHHSIIPLFRFAGYARIRVLACALAVALAGTGAAQAQEAVAEAPQALLLKAMFRLEVAGETFAQAARLAEACDAEAAAEVAAAAQAYRARESGAIRDELEAAFGERAREAFGNFVDAYVQASKEGNAAFLATLAKAVGGWEEDPADYAALSQGMVQRVLREEVAEAGVFLADIQTWIDLKGRTGEVPPLAAWLDRAVPVQTARQVTRESRPVKRNPLREAEAPADEYAGEAGGGPGALEGFGAAREARRAKALDDARAGMQQVAEERRAAEDEAAARKLAAAQTEAEAVRKRAEKLAATQAEAIEQRRNSWSGRLKSVLTTVIGTTSGVFLGEVGGRAGRAAADAVFNTDQDRHDGR